MALLGRSFLGLMVFFAFATPPAIGQGARRIDPSRSAPARRLPADAHLINVLEAPYLARGDGENDDTAAIQLALRASPPNGAAEVTVYFPPGTYRLTDSLVLDGGNVTLLGAGAKVTTLQLDDNLAAFSSSATPKGVLTSVNSETGVVIPARRQIAGLAVDVGRNNPGAVGVELAGFRGGGLRNVIVRSRDRLRRGVAGLSIPDREPTGCWVKRVRVTGFDTGISVVGSEHTVVFEGIELRKQNVVGLLNRLGLVSVCGVRSINEVPAIQNRHSKRSAGQRWGIVVVMDGVFSGGNSEVSAIENEAGLHLNNVRSTGYASILVNKGEVFSGSSISSVFVEQRRLSVFESPSIALGLEVRTAPRVAAGHVSRWTNVESFGADGSDSEDDTSAIQAAFSSDNPTIYFPAGNYLVSQTLQLQGRVQRVILFGSKLTAAGPLMISNVDPMFDVLEGPSALIVERGQLAVGNGPGVRHATSGRALVLRNGDFGPLDLVGPGSSFLEGVSGGSVTVAGSHQVWGRDVTLNSAGTKILNDGSDVWVCGLRTSREGTVVHNTNGGRSEILGGLIDPDEDLPLEQPMFRNSEGVLGMVIGESASEGGSRRHEIIVEETRDGITRRLFHNEVPRRDGFGGGAKISSYLGFESRGRPESPGPILFYTFDETEGSSARDQSGGGPDAVLSGASFVAGGIAGGCLAFDGAGDFAALATNFLGNQAGAVSLWFNSVQSPPDAGMLFYASRSSGVTSNGFGAEDELHVHLTGGGEVQFFIEDDRTDVLLITRRPYNDGQWHHVVASWDRDGATELFVDGRREAFTIRTFDPFSFSGSMRLGRSNSSQYFSGLLDQVSVYRRPIPHWEAMNLYFSTLPYTNYPPTTDAGKTLVVQNQGNVLVLPGQANDDGQPFATLSSDWTKVVGTGTVEFFDRQDPTTTATFGQTGSYVLRLTASDGAASTSSDVAVEVLDPLMPPWMNGDVGPVRVSGFALEEVEPGAFTVAGSGEGIGEEVAVYNESFHFVRQTSAALSGIEVVARFPLLGASGPRARAGVMIRAPGSSDAPQVFMGLDSQGRVVFSSRLTAGAATISLATTELFFSPVWVRLRRTSANKVEASYSDNGISWTEIGSALPQFGNTQIELGIAVTSGSKGFLKRIRVTEATVGGY